MKKTKKTQHLSLVASPSKDLSKPKSTSFEEKDCWKASDMGLTVYPGSTETQLYFNSIQQNWLKSWIKKFILFRSTSLQFSTIARYLKSLKSFSFFLAKYYPEISEIGQINENVLTEYLHYLNQKGYKPSHKKKLLVELKVFFDVGESNNWFHVPHEFIRDWIGTAHRSIKTNPRFIPDYVLRQLNQHLDALPEPVKRMVLVIQECGLRVSELVSLCLDCLKQDSKGGWFIEFTRWKMNKDDIIPISPELALVIQEQQKYIQNELGDDFKYLFCATASRGDDFIPQPKLMLSHNVNYYLNKLAETFEIRDSSGQLWHFQSHQFRHTVGTRMINNNVPHHIIQRYLGHSSPAMTQVYAHLHDTTLKKEVAKFHEKVVNISGEIIESVNPEIDNNTELQWMSRKVLGEVLPHGYCGLPAQFTCSKGNACLTCSDFRTTIEFLDQHKEHRERTKEVLEKAQANNWQRQIQVNEDILKGLDNIINALEGDHE